jgi:N utilization substance protein A
MKKARANGPAIDSKELIEALEELEKERGIKKEVILESIETALVTAYKRNFESSENVKVTMDGQTGETHVYAEKEVVEVVENPNLQINLADAQKLSKKLAIGDIAEIEIVPKNFGRIAAQTAKQVIVQKIREESRNILFDAFNERKGEIVSGLVQKADGGVVVLDLGRLEGVMTVREQIPTEKYHVNDKIRAYVVDVERGAKGSPQVLVSRACSDFVRKLFELEIPEIYEGVIELKSVSRDPGSRSKVAVYSPNENIDPVGSCVGQKGIRIQNIINELSGEKIDVIEWNADPAIYISSALLPAQVMAVDVHEEEKFAQVIVPDDQLSLAIGKAGQNARLAAKLTTWKIDIKSESQFREMMQKAQEEAESAEQVQEEIKNEEVIEEPVEEKKAKKATKKSAKKVEESETVEEVKEEKKTTKKAKKEEIIDEAEEKPKKTTKKATKKADDSEEVEKKPKKTAKKSTKKSEESEETEEEPAKEKKTKKKTDE